MKKAVALSYNNDKDMAPIIRAKGQGTVAENILEEATEKEVYIHEDKALVEELLKEDIGDEVPVEMYEVVAEILVFVNHLDDMME